MVSPLKGRPKTGKHAKGLLRPHCWCTGPDPVVHDMYHPWQMAKAQANFRKEAWSLTFEQYRDMWMPYWEQRGRKPKDVCMTRQDADGAWEEGNVIIITREEHFKMQAQRRNNGQMKFKAPPGRPPKTGV